MAATFKDKKPASATSHKNGRAIIFKLVIAVLPLYPAVRINLDAAQGQGSTWAVVAIGFVIFGAVCVENAVHGLRGKQVISGALWSLLGVGFLALNVMNALANVAAHSDHFRDQNRAKMVAVSDLSSQRHQLSQRRADQAKVAGEETPEAIEAEAKALKASNAKLWSNTYSCDPAWATRDAAREFCASLADLEKKKAAAVKRDQIDAQIAKLDDKAEAKGDAPSTVDSFADAMAEGFAAFGYSVDDKGKIAITRARDWGKAIGVEILAGFGPSGLLLLLLRAGGHSPKIERPAPQPKPQADPGSKAAQKSAIETVLALPAPHGDPLHSFIARRLEKHEGEMIAAGDLWKLWKEDCHDCGIDIGSQQAFGRAMKKWFAHEKNSGRPRYLNVRIKPKEQASLRLVSNRA